MERGSHRETTLLVEGGNGGSLCRRRMRSRKIRQEGVWVPVSMSGRSECGEAQEGNGKKQNKTVGAWTKVTFLGTRGGMVRNKPNDCRIQGPRVFRPLENHPSWVCCSPTFKNRIDVWIGTYCRCSEQNKDHEYKIQEPFIFFFVLKQTFSNL